ncbi:P-loop containing nucleoside triphosphate hydrolase protein [Mycena olivaceomarginata]|nr:P-loop containing nucleoside triphosphate hydrolase protein [Mycena olivaceomarginata]
MVQNVKRNKDECAQLMENIHPVLYAIINLHLKAETVESLSPEMLDNIGKFMETLHKIYTFLEGQQDGNRFKYLFRNNELQKLFRDCHAGLDQAVEVFEVTTRPLWVNDIDVMKKTAQLMHEELFELIQTLSDSSTISNGSSGGNESKNSSTSFSMVPSKPKIFYGRQSEVETIMKILNQESPRIAILGGGGMGKTSLAKAILHHPQTLEKFQHRFFVSAEAATTSIELAALIGLHVGLNPGTDLTRPVVQYLSQKPSCLLILDNLETVWEPMQSRGGIEEFLSLLTEVKHLALLITMRGAERPGKVRWTHPFLLPLQPLSAEAAQQTFMDITDNAYKKEDMEQILQFTDNMPLAVDLIAHLADYEGLSNVLARWQTERTSLLTLGYDRKSNMDVSISLSLSSPRITSESKELLSLLSILPDGLSDGELVQYKLPIRNILSCKSALLATSLAYQDDKRRLQSLIPMREHIQKFLPPSLALVQCLRKGLYTLLELYQKYNGEQLGLVINQITLNLANFHQILQQGLYNHAPDLGITIHGISSLNSFHRLTGRGYTGLLDSILPILPGLDDHQLQLHFINEVLMSPAYYPCLDREQLITQALNMIEHINNPLFVYKFYHAAGFYFQFVRSDIHQAMQFYNKALDFSRSCQDTEKQCGALMSIAQLKYMTGDYCTAQAHIAQALQLSNQPQICFRKQMHCILELNAPSI